MENHDFKSPMSILLALWTFFAGLMDLQSWVLVISLICTVVTTITVVRTNLEKKRYYALQNRGISKKDRVND